MLKFIHSVQTKFGPGQDNGNNVININDLDFESDISMEAMWFALNHKSYQSNYLFQVDIAWSDFKKYEPMLNDRSEILWRINMDRTKSRLFPKKPEEGAKR